MLCQTHYHNLTFGLKKNWGKNNATRNYNDKVHVTYDFVCVFSTERRKTASHVTIITVNVIQRFTRWRWPFGILALGTPQCVPGLWGERSCCRALSHSLQSCERRGGTHFKDSEWIFSEWQWFCFLFTDEGNNETADLDSFHNEKVGFFFLWRIWHSGD